MSQFGNGQTDAIGTSGLRLVGLMLGTTFAVVLSPVVVVWDVETVDVDVVRLTVSSLKSRVWT